MSINTRPRPNPQRRVVFQRTVLAAVAVAALVTGTVCLNSAQDAAVASLTSSVSHTKAVAKLITVANPKRVALIVSLKAQIAAATWKVLDPAIITAATAQTTKSARVVADAAKFTAGANTTVRRGVVGSTNAFPSDIEANAEKIESVDFLPTEKALAGSDEALAKTVAALNAGVTAWNAEQARVAAVQKAAADAAAAQAAQATSVRHVAPRAVAVQTNAPTAAPAATGDSKLAIAQTVFARFGFGNVNYNSSLGASHYAVTDLNHQIIYVHLGNIPASRVSSACIHEYMHILQARTYGSYAATVAHFGSVLGMEQAADRAARANGATWTNYI